MHHVQLFSCMQMMNICIIIIGILPPQMEIFKGLSPYLGMTFKTLRLKESVSRVSIRTHTGR
jgi:hypothetical protein